MSNLRSLIHYADKARFSEIVGAASSTEAYHNHGSEYKQIKLLNNFQSSFFRNCWWNCYRWVAPQDTKFVKFEIWGGGGSSPTVQCCMFGMGGGAGAYPNFPGGTGGGGTGSTGGGNGYDGIDYTGGGGGGASGSGHSKSAQQRTAAAEPVFA